MWYYLYVESKNIQYNWTYLPKKNKHKCRKQIYDYQTRRGEGINLEFEISRYKLLYITCKQSDWQLINLQNIQTAQLKYVYYHMWNRSPVQVWFMKQSTQSQCTGTTQRDGWGVRWEGGSGWGTHVHPWMIHVDVWQKPPQYCKVIRL